MPQISFLQIAMRKKKLKCERFLDEMSNVVPWKKLANEIHPFYVEKDTGRKKTNLSLLLKIYCLQQWYNLSDPGVEEAIYDRNSFQKFLKIDLLANNVPDETTILNFRHLLENHKLQVKFFDVIKNILDEKGLIVKNGTITDAVIINAPSSTKNKDKKRDEEMTSTKKGNNWYFGMKGHAGVDADSGIVHSFTTTTAKNHDKTKQEDLLHGEEKAVFGDKGYFDENNKKECRNRGIYYGVLDKAKRGKKLSNNQKKRNRKLSSIRAKVEHPFRVLKCQWGYTKTRYKGLEKNSMQLYAMFGLINLYLTRKVLMSTTETRVDGA